MAKPLRQRRKQPRIAKPDWVADGICPACEKKIFLSKKAAKNASRIHHPYDNLSPYQCRSTSPLRPDPAPWHYGHLDEEVKSGELGRSARYDEGIFNPETVECTHRNKSGLKCSLPQDHKPQPHLARTFSGDWINMEDQ